MTRTRRVVAVAVLATLCCAGVVAASSRTATQGPSAAQSVIPGEDPLVQRWFKNRENMQIELNNALQAARGLTGPSPVCTRLIIVSWRLQTYQRIPVAKLDGPVNAGVEQFHQAGRACLAGDFDTMRQRIDEGTTKRADAQHHVDEMLHGEE